MLNYERLVPGLNKVCRSKAKELARGGNANQNQLITRKHANMFAWVLTVNCHARQDSSEDDEHPVRSYQRMAFASAKITARQKKIRAVDWSEPASAESLPRNLPKKGDRIKLFDEEVRQHVRCVVAGWRMDDSGYWHTAVPFESNRTDHIYSLNLKKTRWMYTEVEWDVENRDGMVCRPPSQKS